MQHVIPYVDYNVNNFFIYDATKRCNIKVKTLCTRFYIYITYYVLT